MKCTRDGEQIADIWLQGDQLPQVKSFKYLGSLVASDGKSKKETVTRTAQAKEAFNKKRSLLISTALSVKSLSM